MLIAWSKGKLPLNTKQRLLRDDFSKFWEPSGLVQETFVQNFDQIFILRIQEASLKPEKCVQLAAVLVDVKGARASARMAMYHWSFRPEAAAEPN